MQWFTFNKHFCDENFSTNLSARKIFDPQFLIDILTTSHCARTLQILQLEDNS